MADKLHFDLVSPEKRLFEGDVDMVVVPGEEGDFGVLPGHAPLMSAIRMGAISVHDGGTVTRTFIRGGFAEVTPDGLSVLAEEAIDLSSFDASGLATEIQNARDDITAAKDEAARDRAEAALARLEALRDAAAA
ncbi:MAG: F0F1 ATP synthase subunit epsilon [Maricaulis sp.]|jgi:F-type H+-transporting ATPase subunit epsilon|nr:F0F1 ATP synthase subunit epsilon [Maricaulis sp.]HAQ36495.1 F0F1 ATP synthase subunit epsilon [Alphaproteobacteria bacterium]